MRRADHCLTAAPVGARRHTDHLVEGAGEGRHRLVTDRLGHLGHRLAFLEQPARRAHAQAEQHLPRRLPGQCVEALGEGGARQQRLANF
ncbi:hypothetical protein D3C80_2044230 [compost metagenome]